MINDSSEDLMREKNAQLEAIIDNMSDAVLVFDKDYKPIIFNNAMRNFFTFFNANIKHCRDLFDLADYYDEDDQLLTFDELPFDSILNGEKVPPRVFIVKTKTDNCIIAYFSISGGPILDDEGNVLFGILSGQDITKLKKCEELKKSHEARILSIEKEKNEALLKIIEMKDEFLSILSHEFKTPITVINSAIQAMELICKDELSAKGKGFLNKIRQNTNRQLKLVNNLLDITRINSGCLKVNKKDKDIVLLTRSITESIEIFAEQKGIKLSFSSTLGKKVIGIDEEKYERILLNLLSNAVKFTPDNKSITVNVCQKTINGKCKVCVQVRDKGIGIPDDKQKLIFERFGQVDSSLSRQAEGTGIGLYLVKMLVEMLGGEIMLESKVGLGSKFTILLPVEKAKETPIEQLLIEITDKRMIQATAIEFSDVYL